MIEIMSRPWDQIFASAPERRVATGAVLFRRGDPVRDAFLLRQGRVDLDRGLADGTVLTLDRTGAGELVARASLFAESYHCDGLCAEDVRVAVLPRGDVLKALDRRQGALSALAETARDVQALRARVEVMRLRTVRARLDAYLELYGPPPPGGWVRVADWIGISPPALYRELARRRTDG